MRIICAGGGPAGLYFAVLAKLAGRADVTFVGLDEARTLWDTATAEDVRALLPGPFTLVLPNPGRRFRWLTGSNPEAIGVRVPDRPAQRRRTSRRHLGGQCTAKAIGLRSAEDGLYLVGLLEHP